MIQLFQEINAIPFWYKTSFGIPQQSIFILNKRLFLEEFKYTGTIISL